MKRVDLLLRRAIPYTHEGLFAAHFPTLCKDFGIDCRVFSLLEGNFSEYLLEIQRAPPDLTMSFKEVCLAGPNNLLCDELRIPHFFWMDRRPSSALFYLKSPYGIVGCPDLKLSSILKNIGGRRLFHNPILLFDIHSSISHEKRYNAVFFGSLINLEEFLKERKELFSPKDFTIFHMAIDEYNHTSNLPIECLIYVTQSLKTDIKEIHFTEILFHLERYAKAKTVEKYIHSFKKHQLHVFGWHRGANLLKKVGSNIHLHSAVYFTEQVKILRMSKYALFSHELTPYGVTEQFLRSILVNCMPLSLKTPYIQELFSELCVDLAEEFEAKISLFEENIKKREGVLKHAQDTTKRRYSIQRAMTHFLKELSTFLP